MSVSPTVVIPSFNAAETLGEQLAALGTQDTAVAFDVLVSDNGSTDGTAELVESFRGRLPVRLVDASARRGASAARNIGAAAAQGSVLLFCDADDVVAPGWVEAMTSALRDAAFTAGAVEHARLNPGREWDFGWDRPTFTSPAMPYLPAGGSGNMGVRADAFSTVGGFDESLASAEDLDFSWRMQLAGYELVGVPGAVVHVRKRGGIGDAVRQAYAKGEGTRIIAHRYAKVREAFERAGEPPAAIAVTEDMPPEPPDQPGRLRRLPRKAIEILRSPSHLTPYGAAIAHRVGYRRAVIDGIAQIPAPTALPRRRLEKP